jgi:hypothetical protein
MLARVPGEGRPDIEELHAVKIRNRTLAALAAASLAAAIGAAPASAAGSLHGGNYKCYQFDPFSGYLYWGKVKITGDKYGITAGKGKYRVKGKKVTWTSGPLKRYKWTGTKVSSKKFRIIGKADNIKINCNR